MSEKCKEYKELDIGKRAFKALNKLRHPHERMPELVRGHRLTAYDL